MKKTLLSSLLAAVVSVAANASDSGIYQETETVTTRVRYNITETVVAAKPECGYVANVRCARPAPRPVYAAPVRVKTHTEVIDHYQLYRPVVNYVPAGTYAQRRVCTAC